MVNNDGLNALTQYHNATSSNQRKALVKSLLNHSRSNLLSIRRGEAGQRERFIKLFYAAGETINGTKVQVPDCLKSPEFSLKHLCRETIRKHLLDIDPHQHLFGRIPKLRLPSSLTAYLLYNVSLDDDCHAM